MISETTKFLNLHSQVETKLKKDENTKKKNNKNKSIYLIYANLLDRKLLDFLLRLFIVFPMLTHTRTQKTSSNSSPTSLSHKQTQRKFIHCLMNVSKRVGCNTTQTNYESLKYVH